MPTVYYPAFDVAEVDTDGLMVPVGSINLDVDNITQSTSLGTVPVTADGRVAEGSFTANEGDIVEFSNGAYPNAFRMRLCATQDEAYLHAENHVSTFILENSYATNTEVLEADVYAQDLDDMGQRPFKLGTVLAGETASLPYQSSLPKNLRLFLVSKDESGAQDTSELAYAEFDDLAVPALTPAIVIGSTPVTSGTDGRVFFQAGGVVSQSPNLTFNGSALGVTGRINAVATDTTLPVIRAQAAPGHSGNIFEVRDGGGTLGFWMDLNSRLHAPFMYADTIYSAASLLNIYTLNSLNFNNGSKFLQNDPLDYGVALYTGSPATRNFVFDASGRLGIGISSPQDGLHLGSGKQIRFTGTYGPSGDVRLVENGGALSIVATGVTPQFRLLPYGNDIWFQNTNTGGDIYFSGNSGAALTGSVRFEASTLYTPGTIQRSSGTAQAVIGYMAAASSYGGIWFGANAHLRGSGSYSFLYDYVQDKTVLNGAAGVEIRVNNSSDPEVNIDSNSRMGVGVAYNEALNARLNVRSTTEQLRVLYDGSNYYKTTVSSAGVVTLDAVGASAKFTFADKVEVPDQVYGGGWNADLSVPTKNAFYNLVTDMGWVKNNATLGAPSTSDDDTQGYNYNSLWMDITSSPPDAYICKDPSTGAAVWVKFA
jgi:hypothetical protein